MSKESIKKTIIDLRASIAREREQKKKDNARIAAGAVVLQDVPANATAVGVPAQIVRINGEKVRRYADEVDQTNVVNPTLQKIEALTRRVEELEKKLEEAENKNPD